MLRNEQGMAASGGNMASFERPIDLVHLARQTLGDRSLEQEILTLYLKQAQTLLARIEEVGCTRERSDLAHTLKGSSRAVGAWQVASAAEAIEIVPPQQDAEFRQTLEGLKTCVRAACETIADLQRAH
jgi:HPt (histidine-containing phosphotransfer) domain-containing protein